jgi:uncharacterized protein
MTLTAITALSLGLLGSLHCVGMCGPIALALPLVQSNSFTKLLSISLYNIGRAFTYSLFGVLFGLVGSGFAFFGLQQMLSVSLGALILLFIVLPKKISSNLGPVRFVYNKWNGLRELFSELLKKRSLPFLFIIGLLNGLLPCGLVYMAIAGSIATADWKSGGLFMFLFGLGTIPAMFTLSLFSNLINVRFRRRLNKAVPYFLSAMAIMMMLRGMNLGIPYLSPAALKEPSSVNCHSDAKCRQDQKIPLPICCTKK